MKKTVSLLLTVLLLVTLVAGCGDGGGESSAPPESLAPPSYVAPPESVEPPEDGIVLPLTEETVSFTFYVLAVRAFEGWTDYNSSHWFKEMEYRTNVHIEPQEFTAVESFQTMILSGEYPDFIMRVKDNYTGGVDKCIRDNVIIDLNDAVNQYMPNYKYHVYRTPEIFMQSISDSGALWGIQHIVDYPQGPWAGIGLRKDWLDRAGLGIPKTRAEFETALESMKQYMSSDGGPYWPSPLGGSLYGTGINSAFNLPGGTPSGVLNVDGKAVHSGNMSTLKDYAQMMRDWYEMNLLNHDFIGSTEYLASVAKVSTDEIGFFEYMYVNAGMYTSVAEDPNFELYPVAPPTVYDGQTYDDMHVRQTQSYVRSSNSMSISSACHNLELACKYWDYAWTDEGILLANWGISEEDIANGKASPGARATYAVDPSDANGDGNLEYYLPWLFDEYATISDIQYLFVAFNFPTYSIWSREIGELEPNVKMASTVWGQLDDSYVWPEAVTLTAEEGEEAAGISTNCRTAIGEWFIAVIVGDLDSSTYETQLLPTLESMNIARVEELYQQALDRFYARAAFYTAG